MKKLLVAVFFSLTFIGFGASTALANIDLASTDPSYATGPFQFYCPPYTHSFGDGKHYLPKGVRNIGFECRFSIPSDVFSVYGRAAVAVYKGVPGNAKILSGDGVYDENYTLVNLLPTNLYETDEEGNIIFNKPGDDFFSVVFPIDQNDHSVVEGFGNFFSTGTPPPNDHYKIIRWKWGQTLPSEYDPVVIIPGILGSWQNIFGTWVLDPMTHIYDNLIDTLKANGFAENQTLFTFPYDWEKSNVDTAKLLAQKIAYIKTICGCDKVDLVAHSMGGLVATQYIESKDYKDDVDQLIMLGTPIAGSPKAYVTWESGQVLSPSVYTSTILGRIFSREAADNGYSSVASYLQNKPVPSVRELLPISNYLTRNSTVLKYPTGYPQNTFLQNLIGDSSKFILKVLNKVQVSVVTGDTGPHSTITGYTIKPSTQLPLWKDGEPVATSTGSGDDTVPASSLPYFLPSDLTLVGSSHNELASSSEGYVFTKLTGKEPSLLISIIKPAIQKDWATLIAKTFPSKSDFPYFVKMVKDAFVSEFKQHSLLLIVLFSPIDVKVTAPNGAQTGENFASGANLNQIPNAVYSGPLDEYEYIVIQDPLPGQYKVETIGTGNGAFTVAAGRINSATTSTLLVSGTTTLNQIISNTLFVSSTSTSITLTSPSAPIATSTATPLDTCITDITKAYQSKWISKKAVFNRLMLDCKNLQKLSKARHAAKTMLEVRLIDSSIRVALTDMDNLPKDKSSTRDAVSLINKITTWFRTHELG